MCPDLGTKRYLPSTIYNVPLLGGVSISKGTFCNINVLVPVSDQKGHFVTPMISIYVEPFFLEHLKHMTGRTIKFKTLVTLSCHKVIKV